MSEIPEAKSLRWLAVQFPFTEDAKDDIDRMTNAIHVYCTAGADKIDEFAKALEVVKNEDDCCVWRLHPKFDGFVKAGCSPSSLKLDHTTVEFIYCPYCGKVIKNGEDINEPKD